MNEKNINHFKDEFFDLLVKSKNYWMEDIPSKFDEDVFNLIQNIFNLDLEKKQFIASGFNLKAFRVISLFSERMASLAVRENNKNRLIIGLFALVLSLNSGEFRDAVTILSLYFDASKKINEDPHIIFTFVSDSLGKSDFLLDYLSRKPEDQTIQVMGYEESKNEAGFVYKRNW